MRVSDLEQLAARLHQLREQLNHSSLPREQALAGYSPLVEAAKECEFMLPPTLTVATLAETVERKIANVNVLLERARRHESLPDIAQAAAEQEYTLTEEDYQHERHEPDGQHGARQ